VAGTARRRGIIAEINVTPLVDIMLVLLIIFMLTAHLIAKQAIAVDLPRASQSTALPPTTIAVTLTRDGALFLNSVPVTPEGLRAAVREAVAKDPKTQAIVVGD
jgi:biopolymer transport protein ExbD